jgi:hypothetical protein
MKKTIFTFLFLFSLGMVSVFANDGHGINRQVLASFNQDFANAKQVSWEKEKHYYDASFVLNSQYMKAYYNDERILLAVVHHILTDHLPIYLLNSLKNNYTDFWVSKLYESANEWGSNYHITLENADQILEMKSVDAREWVTVKKVKKLDL